MKKILSNVLLILTMILSFTGIVSAKHLPAGTNYNYSIDMYTDTFYVTYDLDGGYLSNRINTYTPQDRDINIGIPTKNGYMFTGWTGTNGNIPNTNVVIKHNSIYNYKLKANWELIPYNVIFDLNGGEGESGPIYYNITTEQIVLGEPYRKGYEFDGWTGTDLSSKTKNVSFNKDNLKERHYTANWKAITYNIYYDANDNNISKANMPNNPNNYNIESNNFNLNNPSRDGYTFEGWIGSDNNSSNKNIGINKGNIGDKFYQATWKVITYTIKYNLNGGTGVNNRTYTIETPSFNLPSPTRTGYTFTGWTGSNGTTPQKDVTIYQTFGNKEYSANWEANKYKVTLDKNGGTGGQNEVTATYDNPIPTVTVPTRTGYTFLGYYDSRDGGTKYINANGTSAKNWDKAGNTTLYAHWQINNYIVNYYKDGNRIDQKTVTYGSDIPNFTPGGYDGYHKFGGWSGWPSNGKMPANDLRLDAITSEAYCMFQTGTASKTNAQGLSQIFTNFGFSSSLYNNDLGWGAITGYNLSRYQVDNLRTSGFSNIHYSSSQGEPWINWLTIECDNGHGEVWKRYSGGNSWQILSSH